MPASPRLCARCESPVESGDLRCAVCCLPIPAANDADPTHTHASVLRCDGCGAAVTYRVEIQAPKCSFCQSVMHIEEPEDPIEEADDYLPFQVDRDAASLALRTWLSSLGWFRPGDLRSAATVESLKPLWWVGWTFDADGSVSWTADSDAGSRKAAWAPHAGEAPLTLRNLAVSASRGLSAPETATLIPSYDLGTAVPTPNGPPSTIIERFDVQRSAARAIISSALASQAQAEAASWIPGTTYRNLHTDVLIRSLHTRRHAFPAWVLAYRYSDRLYRAVISGQSVECIVGTAPYSWRKILATIAAAAFFAMLVLWLLLN